MITLFKNERPLAFFSWTALLLGLTAIGLSIPVFITWVETGLVPRFPTAILSSTLMVMAFLSLAVGLVLDTVTRGRREVKRLRYLEIPAPQACVEPKAAVRSEPAAS